MVDWLSWFNQLNEHNQPNIFKETEFWLISQNSFSFAKAIDLLSRSRIVKTFRFRGRVLGNSGIIAWPPIPQISDESIQSISA